jgi:hypothetical protein
MIDGISLGFLSFLSLLLSWFNLPLWLRRWTLQHSIITELAAGFSTWFFLTAVSKTLIAVIGSTVAGLLVNLAIVFFEKTGWLDD